MQENRASVSQWRVKAKQFFYHELLPNSETLTLRSAVRTETSSGLAPNSALRRYLFSVERPEATS